MNPQPTLQTPASRSGTCTPAQPVSTSPEPPGDRPASRADIYILQAPSERTRGARGLWRAGPPKGRTRAVPTQYPRYAAADPKTAYRASSAPCSGPVLAYSRKTGSRYPPNLPPVDRATLAAPPIYPLLARGGRGPTARALGPPVGPPEWPYPPESPTSVVLHASELEIPESTIKPHCALL